MPDALELLKTRRSVKPIELIGPGPTASEIETLLRIASRVPDHGKLAPWRFILFEGMLAPRPASRSRRYFVRTVPTLPPSRLTSSAGGSHARRW